MELWQISYNPETRGHKHVTSGGQAHALLAALAVHVFRDLRLSAAVWEHGSEWIVLNAEPEPFRSEYEHGADIRRPQYTGRMLEEAVRRRSIVAGRNGGYEDRFAPIVIGSKVVAVLVVGPFWRAPRQASAIREAWRALTGRDTRRADPELARYVAMALSMLALNDAQIQELERLITSLVALVSGEGRADDRMNEIEAAQFALGRARYPERTWELLHDVLDDEALRSPHGGARGNDLRDAGLPRLSDHVIVGLSSSRAEGDFVEEALRRHALQRRAAELARATGYAVSGRVRDHGVVLLCGAGGPQARRRQRALDLGERVAAAGRALGFDVYLGLSPVDKAAPIGPAYHAALGAAADAVATGKRLVIARHGGRAVETSLRALRRQMRTTIDTAPERFAATFDRYLEVAAQRHAYRVEPLCAHLEVAFEQVLEPLVDGGALDEKALTDATESLRRRTASATTPSAVLDAYRRAAAEIAGSTSRAVPARQDRNLRAAIDFIHEHYAEPLRRNAVAKIAGFAPGYFSELFKRREGVTLERYIGGLRIERAKELLDGTDLTVGRIARLSGYKTPEYFARAFRRASGSTPVAYRAGLRRSPPAPGSPSRATD
jgi:AraC-like DNA-binding protein